MFKTNMVPVQARLPYIKVGRDNLVEVSDEMSKQTCRLLYFHEVKILQTANHKKNIDELQKQDKLTLCSYLYK